MRLSKPLATLVLFALAGGAVLTCATCGMLPIADPSEPGFAFGSVDRADDGALLKGRLLETRELEAAGTTWPATGWVHYHEGRLDSFDLAQAFRPPGWGEGRELPAGTRVALEADGSVNFVFLPEDATIDGVPVNGGGKVMTKFHPDGRLRMAFLSRDADIDGIPCDASLFHNVTLHPNGKLDTAVLAEDAVIDGQAFERGDSIRLDVNGRLRAE